MSTEVRLPKPARSVTQAGTRATSVMVDPSDRFGDVTNSAAPSYSGSISAPATTATARRKPTSRGSAATSSSTASGTPRTWEERRSLAS
jgi:hypothetical protein